MDFIIGPEVITSYKRISYSPWHAFAEFVDNSTQSFFDNKKVLLKMYKKEKKLLKVSITYNSEAIVIEDNAMGMDEEDLKSALYVGKLPKNREGRSQYGMGMKTSACWLGDNWVIETKKLDNDTAYSVKIDVNNIASGKKDCEFTNIKKSREEHYTKITIEKLNRQFSSRTIGKIKEFLASMYRVDIRSDDLVILWNGEEIKGYDFTDRIAKDHLGRPYKKDFSFEVKGKKVNGWGAVFAYGKRRDAGFSIIRRNRVIKGWPDSWRPYELFGEERNDLVNQRLFGEIYLNDFDVTHAKDDIQWQGLEEEEIEALLYNELKEYRDFSINNKTGMEDERRPSVEQYKLAAVHLLKELESDKLAEKIELAETFPSDNSIQLVKESIIKGIVGIEQPVIDVKVNELKIRLYYSLRSPAEYYFVLDNANIDEIDIIVNISHPHLLELTSEQSQINFLKHCIYDGVAEWQARKIKRVSFDTVKVLKDQLLRASFEIEQEYE